MKSANQKQNPSVYRWLFFVAGLFTSCALVMIYIVYTVDPFMYYRTPEKYTYYDARYCLAGLLKNEDYDTLLVGSSMMQNTSLSVVDKAGWKAIKATCGGACPSDINSFIEYAMKYKNPSRYVIAIDSLTFIYKPDYRRADIPDYLYDDNLWNNGKYWFNNNVWMTLFPNSLIHTKPIKANKLDLGDVDSWAARATFGKDEMLKTIKLDDLSKTSDNKSNLEQMKASYDVTVYRIAAAHPDADFYLLYPPYSVLMWYGKANEVKLQDALEFKKYIADKKLPNIRIFDFQDNADIITQLDNYKDISHFRPAINDYMMECVISGENEVASVSDQLASNKRQLDVVNNWSLAD